MENLRLPKTVEDQCVALCQPFDPAEVKLLDKGRGKKLNYVQVSTIMNRLDEVFGPLHWEPAYDLLTDHSWRCRLKVTFCDGTTVIKEGIGGTAGMSDAGDDDKSGATDALKRACQALGVGRYLWECGVPRFARGGSWGGEVKTTGEVIDARPRPAPATASNGAVAPGATTAAAHHAPAAVAGPREGWDERNARVPRECKHLFPRLKSLEEYFGEPIIKPLDKWAATAGLPRKYQDWTAEDIGRAWPQVAAICAAFPGYAGEFGGAAATPAPASPPAGGQSPAAADPLKAAKGRLWTEATKLAARALGRAPAQAEVMAEIAPVVAELAGGPVDLPACTDPGLLGRAADSMAKLNDIPF